jgi:L-lactate dehydrogenase (cytochrome)
MRRVHAIADVQRRARRVLPRILRDFVEGGADNELTMRANEQSFQRIGLRPRMATFVAEPELGTTILGRHYNLPVMLAPCGGISLLHPDGQIGAVRAAARFGTTAVVGTLSGESLERAAEPATDAARWFQLYPLGGRDGAKILVRRAAEAGYDVLMVTIDTPTTGRKLRDLRNGGIQPGGMPISRITPGAVARFAPKVIGHPRWAYRFATTGFALGQPNFAQLTADGPLTPEVANARWMAEPTSWDDVEKIRREWSGPLVVKGLLSGEDARRAVDVGADCVVVSNHGGRQLDATPATIDALPEVVDAVGDRVDVLLDSGVRSGTDVVRALALGARAVFVGRPYLYGLAVDGQKGVEAVLSILQGELRRTLQLLGCPSVSELDISWLDARFRHPDAHSAGHPSAPHEVPSPWAARPLESVRGTAHERAR